jgi:hypothetical protein
MGKYSQLNIRSTKPRKETHPIWRGIGCILMVVVPFLSWGLAYITVKINYSLSTWFIPFQLLGTPYFPPNWFGFGYFDQVLFYFQSIDDFYALVVFTILYMIILAAFISAASALIYRLVNPSRYGPLDAPPPEIKVKPYKR